MKKFAFYAFVWLLGLALLMPVLPVSKAEAAAAAWPDTFTPYTTGGQTIFDKASDEHPIDVDITSGVDNGIGNLPSVYVASDNTNFFVRLRVKGNPYDRKGGFLSSVWEVQLAAQSGSSWVQKATIGIDGKSPSTDYVYIANANGTCRCRERAVFY
jgi:hypothetical protein